MERQAKIFKALGDPTRLGIVKMLLSCEKCVCEIIPKTCKSQPTISAHLKVLHEAGILQSRKEGISVYYRLADASVKDLVKIAERM
jgi:ArsR family transcriptional regulator, arsenate/arsenite/antimonite-responsive transcriptional repressor